MRLSPIFPIKTTIRQASVLILLCATLSAKVEKAPFGNLEDGTQIDLYTLTNSQGLIAKITNYGGVMTELHVPDREGKLDDILLGYDNLASYLEKPSYFNALIGRYGNRIGGAQFELAGKTYTLARNNGRNTLHGGSRGYNRVAWNAEILKGKNAIELTYLSPDGEEGYPGNLNVTVVYELNDHNELSISYTATTDQPTVVNLTQHNFYNLAGQGQGNILNHELTLYAHSFTPVGEGLIPTGAISPVAGTPMDFTRARPVGSRIETDDAQIKLAGGYDHNWVLDQDSPGEMTLAARLYEPTSGREMEVWTTEPGIQFYSGNFFNGNTTGKNGAVYHFRYALCLETQHFPDSPNQPQFPSTRLDPGDVYQSKTIYRFDVQ